VRSAEWITKYKPDAFCLPQALPPFQSSLIRTNKIADIEDLVGGKIVLSQYE
jgi:hypothetical protein